MQLVPGRSHLRRKKKKYNPWQKAELYLKKKFSLNLNYLARIDQTSELNRLTIDNRFQGRVQPLNEMILSLATLISLLIQYVQLIVLSLNDAIYS